MHGGQGVLLPLRIPDKNGGCGKPGAPGAAKKQTQFVFHWRGGGLNREILNEILAGAAEEAGKKGLQVSCAVNVRQAVIQLDFGTTRETELQQPDEGQEDAQA